MIRFLVDFSCRHRAAVISVVLGAAMLGLWSAANLPCDALPDTEDRQVIVFSRWDRNPTIIEDQVTYPLVTRMMGLPRVKTVRSGEIRIIGVGGLGNGLPTSTRLYQGSITTEW